MTDALDTTLFGKTAKVTLADGKEYLLREPDLDTLATLKFQLDNLDDFANVKILVWALLKNDNPQLKEATCGRLVTMTMLSEDSQLMKAIKEVLGKKDNSKKE